MFKVLHIDDEELIREFLADLLGSIYDNVQISSYETWFEANQQIENGEKYDLILLDEVMPDIGGSEIFQVIEKRYPDLADKVVFVTGSMNLGFTDRPRLKKPFGIEDLKKIIDPVFEQKKG